MVIIKVRNADEMGKKAASIIGAQLILKPGSVLGLATGSTPLPAYKYLIEGYENGLYDFSKVTTVNLDEYKGLSPDSDQSYCWYMNTNLFDHVNIDKSNTHLPDGTQDDPELECGKYESLIKSLGGIDLQLLGIGHNGHIGFNEPDDNFPVSTHCVALTESTINANSRLFEKAEDVPRFAYTMGIGTIMAAKKILMIISGRDKAEITKTALFGPVTPRVPASILQLHPDVTIVADQDALSLTDNIL